MNATQTLPGWSEEGALPGTLVLRFDGVNSAAIEQMEIDNFQRGLSAPEAEDRGGLAFATGPRTSSAMTPLRAIGVALGFVFAGIAFGVGGELDLDPNVGYPLMIGAFLLGVSTPHVVRYFLGRRAEVKGVVMTEPFTIEATDDAITVRGASIGAVRLPMSDIAEVVAMPRLGWRDKSGKFSAFPCGYPLRSKNVDLAMRLTQIARQVRSMSSYRGG